MENISLKICLEDFRSRHNGYSPAILGDFDDDNYTDYGKIPYDLKIKKTDKLCKIKDGIPLVKSYNDDKVLLLRYKNMIKTNTFLNEMISGKKYDGNDNVFLNKTIYYQVCSVSGKKTWVEMTDEKWEEINNYVLPSDYEKFFLVDEYGNNVVKGVFPILPPLIHYYYDNLDGKRFSIYDINNTPSYYVYYLKDDDGNYLIPETKISYVKNKYCYSYNEFNSNDIYVKTISDIPTKYLPTIKKHKYTIEERMYQLSICTHKNDFKIGDIIGVNDDAIKYNKIFTKDFIWAQDTCYFDEDVLDYTDNPVYGTKYTYTGETNDEFNNSLLYELIPSPSRFRYDALFKDKVSKLLDRKGYDEDDFEEPYFDLNLYFEEEYDDIGVLTPVLENWEANKKYKIGEVVKYGDGTYRLSNIDKSLVKGKTIDEVLKIYSDKGYVYDRVEVDEHFYTINEDNSEYSYRIYHNTSDGGYYLYEFYYKGYYLKKDRITYFDTTDEYGELTIDSSGEYEHWKRTFVSSETSDLPFKSVCESKINEIKRTVTSTDDDGNVLPFCFINEVRNYGGTKKTIVLADTKIKYMLGKCNIYDGYCNFLYKINIYANDGTNDILLKTFKYDNSVTEDGDDNDKNYISTSNIEDAIEGLTGMTFSIEFKYIIECKIDTTNKNYGISATFDDFGEVKTIECGILYRDRYLFTIDTYSCLVSEYGDEFYELVDYTLKTEATINDDGETEYVATETPDYKISEEPDLTIDNLGKIYLWTGETDSTYTSGNTYICKCVFNYVNIEYNQTYISGETETTGKTVLFSEVAVDEAQLTKDNFQNVDFFKDDALIGIQKFSSDINVYIDRGSGAASERLFGLGEISNFDELTKYRGDIYDLESQKES